MIGRSRQVLLIRPWADAAVDGGCCAADASTINGTAHADQEGRGQLYTTLRAGLPDDVDVQIVHPRNIAYLLPTVLRAGRRRGLSWTAALRGAMQATTPSAVLVDGVVVDLPGADLPRQADGCVHGEAAAREAERVLAVVRAALDASPPAQRADRPI